MLVAVDDMILGHMLCPVFRSLVVARDILLGRTLEHRHVEVGRIQLQDVDQVFPCHIDSTLLEIVAKRPVAQHLEHRVVVGVVAHLFQVVVLT